MAFKKILCAVDFSGASKLALETAARLAVESGADLVIAHAWEAPRHAVFSELLLDHENLAPVVREEKAQLDTLAKEAGRLGATRIEAKLLFGVPWHAIVEETRSDPTYDLVVVGTQGRSGIANVLLGSVAERVARHASCPVLLARPTRPSADTPTKPRP